MDLKLGSGRLMEPGPVDPTPQDDADPTPRDDMARLDALRQEFDAQARRFEQARARLVETIETIQKSASRPDILRNFAYARLLARVETMPVIEQAKGILMAQNRCGPDEAFDLLRRASQRANVKVSVLAAQIVEQVVAPKSADTPRPPRRTGR
jgi:hypothetical protein